MRTRSRVALLGVATAIVASCGERAPTSSGSAADPDASAAPSVMLEPVTTATLTAETATSAPVTAAAESTGRLRVTQHQTACCFTEGQVSYLVVRDGNGMVAIEREFQAIAEIYPVIDVTLPAGPYEIESYQRPCSGNCGFLDEPTDRCEAVAEVSSDGSVFLTAAFAPMEGCSLTETDEPPPSPVPDEFALREPYDDCGLDFAPESEVSEPSQVRLCFAQANEAGTAAEMAAYEPGAIPDTPDYLVYRSNPDRSVEVYLPHLGRATDQPWRRYTCAGIEPDPARGFVLQGCGEPVVIEP